MHDAAVYKHYNMFPESLCGNNEEILERLTELGRIREKGRRILSLELLRKQSMCPLESSSSFNTNDLHIKTMTTFKKIK